MQNAQELFIEASSKLKELERQRNNALTDCTHFAAENAALKKKLEELSKECEELRQIVHESEEDKD